jgi:hypothetical protein
VFFIGPVMHKWFGILDKVHDSSPLTPRHGWWWWSDGGGGAGGARQQGRSSREGGAGSGHHWPSRVLFLLQPDGPHGMVPLVPRMRWLVGGPTARLAIACKVVVVVLVCCS